MLTMRPRAALALTGLAVLAITGCGGTTTVPANGAIRVRQRGLRARQQGTGARPQAGGRARQHGPLAGDQPALRSQQQLRPVRHVPAGG